VVLDSVIEGEVPEEAYAVLVDEIQERLGIMGHASVLANTLTWSPATQGEDSRRVVVSIKSKEGRTRIRVEERFEIRGYRRFFVAAGGVSGAVFAAVLATFTGLADAAMPALLIPFMAAGIWSGVFGTIKFEANTRRPQLQALAGRLKELASRAVEKLPSPKKELGSG
jgi:hypothetical protein